MELERLDCIYVERILGDYRSVRMMEYGYGELKWRQVVQTVDEERRWLNRDNKKLVRILKKYCHEKTILIGNELAIKELGAINYLFEMRKKELQNGARNVMCRMDEAVTGRRSVFLAVIESDKWSQWEIRELLEVAKDFYEDIYMLIRSATLNVEALMEFFYLEYGIVIHTITERTVGGLEADFGLFLLNQWDEVYQTYSVRRGYVLSEWEKGLKRRRRNIGKAGLRRMEGNVLYAGFVYEYRGRQLPYEVGVVWANHPFLQRKICHSEKENPISAVAIYGVE